MAPNGTVAWVQAMVQDPVNADESRFQSCKLTADKSSLTVIGYTYEANATLGTKSIAVTGRTYSQVIAMLNPATGAVTYLGALCTPSRGAYAESRIASGPGNVMYFTVRFLNTATFSDGGTIACPGSVCCGVLKYTGNTRNWAKILDQSNCYRGGVALSADGTKLYAGSQKMLFVLNAATGDELSNVTIGGISEIKSVVLIGTNVFVYGWMMNTAPAVSVGNVSVPFPNATVSVAAVLLRFTASGNSLAASAGTWIGTDNELKGSPMHMVRAYNVSGYSNALYATVELSATKLKSGTGYSSAQFHPYGANSSYQYGVSDYI